MSAAADGRALSVWQAEAHVQDLADALQSAMSDAYADASAQEMRKALANVVEALTPAEAFDFGSALNRIAKGTQQVLADPTFKAVAGTALPIAGRLVGTYFGGPMGGELGANLGNLAVGALTSQGGQPPMAPPPAPVPSPPAPTRPPAPAPAPQGHAPAAGPSSAATPGPTPSAASITSPVAGGSSAATQAVVLCQQPDVLRALLATALGQYGRKEVSGLPNAQVLSQLSRLFGEAAADADELMYLDQVSEAQGAEAAWRGLLPSEPPVALYADLIGADNVELAEAAEWEGMF
jgi:hypothetical protein